MAKTILITSGKGGVGKTTIAAMLSIQLSRLGKKVLVFDYDIGLRNMDIVLGLQSGVVYNVMDYINGDIDIQSILLDHSEHENLSFLPTAQYAKQKDFGAKDLKKVLYKLETLFDYIVIDCPAGIEKSVKNAIKKVDVCIVVATADNVSIRDAEKIIFEIHRNGIVSPCLIVNRINTKLVQKGLMYSPKTVSQILDIRLIGFVEDDIEITASINSKGLPALNSRSFKAINNIARLINGENIKVPDIAKKGILSIFKRN